MISRFADKIVNNNLQYLKLIKSELKLRQKKNSANSENEINDFIRRCQIHKIQIRRI